MNGNGFDLGQAAAYQLGVGSCIANICEQSDGKALLNDPERMNFYCSSRSANRHRNTFRPTQRAQTA